MNPSADKQERIFIEAFRREYVAVDENRNLKHQGTEQIALAAFRAWKASAPSSTADTDREWVKWLQGELAEVMRLANRGLFGDKKDDELTDAMRLHGIRLLLSADTEKYERLLSAVSASTQTEAK